jgi:hypothetical protein
LVSLDWQAAVATITKLTRDRLSVDVSPTDHDSEETRFDTTKTCCICTISYEESGERGAKLPCGHIHGNECMQVWLLEKTTCPSCRKDYDSDLVRSELYSHPFLGNENEDFIAAFNQDLSFFRSCPPRAESKLYTTGWVGNPSDLQLVEVMNLKFPVPGFTFNRVERITILDTETMESWVTRQANWDAGRSRAQFRPMVLRILTYEQRTFAQLIRVYGERNVNPPNIPDKPYSMKVDHFLPNSGFFGSGSSDIPTLMTDLDLHDHRHGDARRGDNSDNGSGTVSEGFSIYAGTISYTLTFHDRTTLQSRTTLQRLTEGNFSYRSTRRVGRFEPRRLTILPDGTLRSDRDPIPFPTTTIPIFSQFDHRGLDIREDFRLECRMVSDEALVIMQEQHPKARDLRRELWRLTDVLASIIAEKGLGPSKLRNARIAKREVKLNRSIYKALWDFFRDDGVVELLQGIEMSTPSLHKRWIDLNRSTAGT